MPNLTPCAPHRVQAGKDGFQPLRRLEYDARAPLVKAGMVGVAALETDMARHRSRVARGWTADAQRGLFFGECQ